jgi:hypothetical protein
MSCALSNDLSQTQFSGSSVCFSISGIAHVTRREKCATDQKTWNEVRKAHMCGYVLFLNLCGCYGELQFETLCSQIYQEIHRINEPEAWTTEAMTELPFTLSDDCAPGWHNTRLISTYGVCCAQWWFDCPSVSVPGYPYYHHTANGS